MKKEPIKNKSQARRADFITSIDAGTSVIGIYANTSESTKENGKKITEKGRAEIRGYALLCA